MADSREPRILPPDDEEEGPSVLKPFLDHLEELRWMLIKMVATLGISMVLCFAFARQLLAVILVPLQQATHNPEPYLRTLEVTGGLNLAMKLSLYAGVIVASPLLLYFLAEFVLPALTVREKKLLVPVFGAGVGLFLAGAALAYFLVVPAGLKWFLDYNTYLGIRSEWVVDNYISFVSHMALAFGLCFELPLVVLVLAKLGIVTHDFLRQRRPYVIVIIFIVAGIITPTTDPLNQCVLALPMIVLYEACIWIARWMERRKRTA